MVCVIHGTALVPGSSNLILRKPRPRTGGVFEGGATGMTGTCRVVDVVTGPLRGNRCIGTVAPISRWCSATLPAAHLLPPTRPQRFHPTHPCHPYHSAGPGPLAARARRPPGAQHRRRRAGWQHAAGLSGVAQPRRRQPAAQRAQQHKPCALPRVRSEGGGREEARQKEGRSRKGGGRRLLHSGFRGGSGTRAPGVARCELRWELEEVGIVGARRGHVRLLSGLKRIMDGGQGALAVLAA